MAKKFKKSLLPEVKRLSKMADIIMVLLLLIILAISILCYQGGYGYLFVVWAPLSAYIVVFYAYLVHILKSQNAELERQHVSLLKSLQRKSEFIYRLVHQIRTPLSTIKNSIDLIIDRELGDITRQQERCLNNVGNCIESLKGMVNSLLEHSMLTSGRTSLEIRMTNLQQLISEALTSVKDLSDRKGIALEMIVPKSLSDIPIDKQKIKLALVNLLDNAIKFSSGGGSTSGISNTSDNARVSIAVKEWDDCVQIGVSDTGCGISQEKQEAIFDEFNKDLVRERDSISGRSSTSGRGLLSDATSGRDGHGLGLSIAKGIIEAHNGELWVESEIRKGSTFSFTLPKENKALDLLRKRQELIKFLNIGLNLTDFIKIEVLQEIQNHFSQSLGVTTFIIDTKGEFITNISQPNRFYNLIRSSREGQDISRKFEIRIGADALKQNRPKIYYSFTGLAHFAAPIIVDNIPMGSIQIEGVQLFTPIDPKKLKELSEWFGLDYDELVASASEIKKLPENTIYAASELLYSIASTISSLCSYEHELTEKIAQLSTLSHLSQAITSTLEFERLLNLIVYTTLSVFDADSGYIMLLDKDSQELIIKSSYGFKKDIIKKVRIRVGEDVPGWVAKEKKPLLVHSKIDDQYFFDLIKKTGVQSCLCAPLTFQDEVIGIFTISRSESPDFNSNDLNLFLTFSTQASLAIEEAQLYNAMEEKANQLEAFTEIGKVILSTLEVEKILNLIMDVIRKTMNVNRCSLHLQDTNNKLTMVASKGLSDEYIKKENEIEVIQETLLKAIKDKETIWVSDLKGIIGDTSILKREGIFSILCVPLVIRKRSIGAITVYSVARHDYSNDEINLLSGFANQSAIAIEHAQLHETVRNGILKIVQELGEVIDIKTAYDEGRSEEKANYAMAIAKKLGITLHSIDITAFLHDIGKITLPKDILYKPGKLTQEEFDIIKKHPLIGIDILETVGLPIDTLTAIRQHHERIDGKGYPDKITGDEILKESAIIQVVDAFVAMTKDRPYRKALSVEEAVKQLQEGAGKQYDPDVVEALIKILDEKN